MRADKDKAMIFLRLIGKGLQKGGAALLLLFRLRWPLWRARRGNIGIVPALSPRLLPTDGWCDCRAAAWRAGSRR